MVSRALVLGGGGNTGFCWQWGVLTALRDADVDITTADLVVGTSAGCSAAVELSSSVDPHDVIKSLDVPQEMPKDKQGNGTDANAAPDPFVEAMKKIVADPSDATQFRAQLGAIAVATPGGSENKLRRMIDHYLTVKDWPEQRVVMAAVDVASGELAVFDRDSGVGLLDAMAASGAVPGAWEPVTIGEHRYMDGCMRSTTNADLAAGHDRVLVVAPIKQMRGVPGTDIETALEPLRTTAGQVTVIRPDEASRAAIGPNLYDLSKRAVAARAGLAQGAQLAESVRKSWLN